MAADTMVPTDGGLTWMPSITGAARVELVPEPATLALFVLGLVGLGFPRRKQR